MVDIPFEDLLILLDKWGAASQPTGDGIATEHEAMVHIVTCAMHADTANKRHLSNHGQHRDLEPRPNPRDEFGGLRAQQAAHVLSQVNRLLQLEKHEIQIYNFPVSEMDPEHHWMRERMPFASAWLEKENWCTRHLMVSVTVGSGAPRGAPTTTWRAPCSRL